MRHTGGQRARFAVAALLAIAMGIGAVAGYALGAGRVPLYLAACVVLLTLAVVGRAAWHRRRAPSRALRSRDRLTAGADGPHAPFDLERDRSTDDQKYVM
jgi:uncharacterized membrane protein YfcA